jgi:CheY-like chemotaxis protein
LIVEDNADAADALCALLEECGHEISVAYDPQTAVALARDRLPHVALIDLDLPLMDGVALARVLRKIPGGEHIRLVAVTGHSSMQHRSAAMKAGFKQYVLKPVDPQEICDLVAQSERSGPNRRLPTGT